MVLTNDILMRVRTSTAFILSLDKEQKRLNKWQVFTNLAEVQECSVWILKHSDSAKIINLYIKTLEQLRDAIKKEGGGGGG